MAFNGDRLALTGVDGATNSVEADLLSGVLRRDLFTAAIDGD